MIALLTIFFREGVKLLAMEYALEWFFSLGGKTIQQIKKPVFKKASKYSFASIASYIGLTRFSADNDKKLLLMCGFIFTLSIYMIYMTKKKKKT